MRALLHAATDWLAQSSLQVEENVRWERMPPAWLVVLVILPLVVLYAGYFYRREPISGRQWWRWLLAGLRILAIVFALALLARPLLRRTTYETRDSTILLLVDDSLSMDIADRYSDRQVSSRLAQLLDTSVEGIESTTRYDLVRRLLADSRIGVLEKLREKGKVAVATFARSVKEVGKAPRFRSEELPAAAPTLPEDVLPPYGDVRNDPRVQETRIAEGLDEAVEWIVGSGFGREEERVSGVLLFSDGQENAGSGSAADVARWLGERGTPVYTIGVGNPEDPRDVRLSNLDVNDVVLVDDQVPLDVTIISDGFEGESVWLTLKIDAVTVRRTTVVLEGGGKKQTARLEHRPEKPGELTATVEIEKLAGEVFYDNNSVSKTIRVLDEKIKVLYLENLPRWEYRYLKNALIRDATMEAQVYLFSADPGFVQESSKGVPSLVRPPQDRADLFRFHVVILGDVLPGDLGPELMSLLKEFVSEGGGIILIAGRHANPSKYVYQDLFALLPVEVKEEDEFGASGLEAFVEDFHVQLSAVGKEHPIMRLVSDRERNIVLWEGKETRGDILPGFYRYSRVEQEKAGAIVLARHPTDLLPLQDRGRPIFAYMNYNKGMSFFSAVDDTWRWRAGVDNLFLGRFWGQVIRFVATGRLLGKTPRFAVTTDKPVYNIGETVVIDARVFDASMKPSTEKTVTLYHQMQGSEGEPPGKIELSLSSVKSPGAYEGALVAAQRGRHDIWLGTETERSAFHSFSVEIPALESRDPRLRRDLLQQVASAGGGQYLDLHEVQKAVDGVQGLSRSQAGLVDRDDLWDEWWILVLFT
ncbi:MAG: hypothetical protein JXA90_12030, partial [Planctomycetes bacterium]|nr:hypothetical protein [Planctomycetota bacterium]